MASVPQSNLPLFYNDLMPLNSRDHAKWRSVSLDKAPWLVGAHAIPLTVDEFVQAQRDFPIVFSSGDNPLPLALMGARWADPMTPPVVGLVRPATPLNWTMPTLTPPLSAAAARSRR